MTEDYAVIYSPAAWDDLRAIYSYIAFMLRAGQAAENQTNRIRDNIRKLQYYPDKHKLVDWEPWTSMGMRIIPVDRYNVYYLIDKTEMTVTVERILYSGRDIRNTLLDEGE